MKRPRVALLSEHASPTATLGGEDSGGQNVYVDEISRSLADHGVDVDVFVRRDNPHLPEIIDWAPGVRVINVTAGPAEFLLKDALWQYMPAFRDAIADFSRRQGIRYDVIHGNFWMSGWVAAELRDRLGIPAVQIFHALGTTKQRHQGLMDTSPAIRIQVERDVIRRVDRIIAQCPAERAELIGDYLADPAKIELVPSGVNRERFRPEDRLACRAQLGIDPDTFVITYVGRMLPRKDIRNLIRAHALLEQQVDRSVVALVVGGDTHDPDPEITPEIGELKRLAGELGTSERVLLTGCRQPDVLRYYYSAGDVAVTTPWYEPFGLTPLEAMSCGVPVIGAAVGGISYTVVDGVTGFLVPPRDPAALAAKLRVIMENPGIRDEMGRAAQRRVEREFTWEVTAGRTARLYRSLLGAGTLVPVARV